MVTLYRVVTSVDRHDFGTEVLEDFAIHWVAVGRERPVRPYQEAIADWSAEEYAAGDPVLHATCAALDQLFLEGQAEAIATFLKNNNGWGSRLEPVQLPVARGQLEPVAPSPRRIPLPADRVRFLPGQRVEAFGEVYPRGQLPPVAAAGAPGVAAVADRPEAASEPSAPLRPQVEVVPPAVGRGIGLRMTLPAGKPRERRPAADRPAAPPGSGQAPSRVTPRVSAPPPASPALQGGAASAAPGSASRSAPGSPPLAVPAPPAPAAVEPCEACERPLAGEQSWQLVHGHRLCLACIESDQQTALEIARARHRARLRALRRALEEGAS